MGRRIGWRPVQQVVKLMLQDDQELLVRRYAWRCQDPPSACCQQLPPWNPASNLPPLLQGGTCRRCHKHQGLRPFCAPLAPVLTRCGMIHALTQLGDRLPHLEHSRREHVGQAVGGMVAGSTPHAALVGV